MSPAPATITDVARAADVSPATVSRVLNGTAAVSEARAERVRAAAATLGYRPFGPARALRRQLTRVWAAIIADIENPFFTAMVRGIEDVARAEGFRLVLCNSDEDLDKERAYVDIVIAERMAGVVIAVASSDESSLQPLLDRRVPIVAVDRRPLDERLDSVVVDNRPAQRTRRPPRRQRLVSDRLHHRPGPRRHRQRTTRRLPRRAPRDTASRVDRGLIRRADFREAGGYRGRPIAARVAHPTRRAVRRQQSHGGGVPCERCASSASRRRATSASWRSTTRRGRHSRRRSLTVVAQPAYEIGQAAAELLATADPDRAAGHVVLSPTLVVRESSVPAP